MRPITLQLSDTGQTISYRDHGSGEPLILIHGVGLQSAAWQPQIETMQNSYRVIAVDMPGHGGSDPLPAGSELQDFVGWFYAFIQTLGLGPVNLAGHSMGALIAGGFACQYPKLTRRVALLNGVFRRNASARQAVGARAHAIEAGDIDLIAPLNRWFGTSPAEAAARTKVEKWLSEMDQAGYANAYSAFAHGDSVYADRMRQIACPFLAITGDGDPNSTPAMAEAMAHEVQNGEAVTIEGHRHMINLTAVEQVNSTLTHWLNLPIKQEAS